MIQPRLSFTPQRRVIAVDTHMNGEILRVVLDGLPALKASSPADALNELREYHDAFRRFVIEPPRGGDGVNACLLLPPFSEKSANSCPTCSIHVQPENTGPVLRNNGRHHRPVAQPSP